DARITVKFAKFLYINNLSPGASVSRVTDPFTSDQVGPPRGLSVGMPAALAPVTPLAGRGSPPGGDLAPGGCREPATGEPVGNLGR
ncbi:MAG: hypothetical protein M0T80_11565, partial [Actinomycetota bacterium]|nr:hypothetical protein [Actinomycetota bacterium]